LVGTEEFFIGAGLPKSKTTDPKTRRGPMPSPIAIYGASWNLRDEQRSNNTRLPVDAKPLTISLSFFAERVSKSSVKLGRVTERLISYKYSQKNLYPHKMLTVRVYREITQDLVAHWTTGPRGDHNDLMLYNFFSPKLQNHFLSMFMRVGIRAIYSRY
jgi:hypothetical protein